LGVRLHSCSHPTVLGATSVLGVTSVCVDKHTSILLHAHQTKASSVKSAEITINKSYVEVCACAEAKKT